MSEMRFDGKSVVITGGGRGFGREHARLLANRGARVVIADYGVNMDGTGSDPSVVEAITKEINDSGGEAIGLCVNVAEEAEAAKVVRAAVDNHGGLDILVNNAGIYNGLWFEDVSSEQVRRMVDFHYLGTVWTTKAAWPHLTKSPTGNVVCTTSESVFGNIPKSVDYAGPKGAVLAFIKAMALNGRAHGVRVNGISPRGATRMATPELLAYVYDRTEFDASGAFEKAMRPEYASAAIGFLAHESCPLSGEVIVCGGGLAMRMFISESKGISAPEGQGLSPEDLRDQMEQLMDPTGAMIMTYDLWN
jgi:NAD(P)-dependent dehydrogenase (short-subunit alcohol dehydrogenase family)